MQDYRSPVRAIESRNNAKHAQFRGQSFKIFRDESPSKPEAALNSVKI